MRLPTPSGRLSLRMQYAMSDYIKSTKPIEAELGPAANLAPEVKALYDRMASMLRILEWADNADCGPFCSICGASKTDGINGGVEPGHTPTCDLSTLLKELP